MFVMCHIDVMVNLNCEKSDHGTNSAYQLQPLTSIKSYLIHKIFEGICTLYIRNYECTLLGTIDKHSYEALPPSPSPEGGC